MLDIFGIRRNMLPTPLPCDSEFLRYKGIPVIGVLGDSHAALFGHGCQRAGQAKATYGTGSSVMMNTGREFMKKKGLSACVGFAYGGEVDYALEGNVTSSGDTLHWLVDLGLFESVEEIARLASTVPDAHGINLVPAFSGLGAPYFDENARGLLNGLTRGSGKAQIAFAALQSIAQQNTDIIEEMAGLHTLYADGGGSGNSWLMQMQSDLARIKVVRQEQKEMSAWGAARMAGLKLDLYDGSTGFCNQTVFMPRADDEQVALWRQGWRSAIKQSRERR